MEYAVVSHHKWFHILIIFFLIYSFLQAPIQLWYAVLDITLIYSAFYPWFSILPSSTMSFPVLLKHSCICFRSIVACRSKMLRSHWIAWPCLQIACPFYLCDMDFLFSILKQLKFYFCLCASLSTVVQYSFQFLSLFCVFEIHMCLKIVKIYVY